MPSSVLMVNSNVALAGMFDRAGGQVGSASAQGVYYQAADWPPGTGALAVCMDIQRF